MKDIREYLREEIEKNERKISACSIVGDISCEAYVEMRGVLRGIYDKIQRVERNKEEDGHKYYKVIAVALTEIMVEAENAEDARAKAEDELTNRDAHWTAVDCIKIKKETFERGFDI